MYFVIFIDESFIDVFIHALFVQQPMCQFYNALLHGVTRGGTLLFELENTGDIYSIW